jgi:hypothetical protein
VRTVNVEVGTIEDLIAYMDHLDLWPASSKSTDIVPSRRIDNDTKKEKPKPMTEEQGSLF